MRKVRRTLLLSALLACSVCAWAADTPGVSFVLKSGEKVSFAFSERPVIRTASDAVSVSVGGTERVSYPLIPQHFFLQEVFMRLELFFSLGLL